MDFEDLRDEVKARGFDYLTPDSRIERLINVIYHDINHRFPWPFLEATAIGTSPLTISDFGHALSVVDTTAENVLEWEDFRTIRESDPALSVSGDPDCWYMSSSALTVYPVNTTNTLSVRYIKVSPDLTTDTSPLLPSRFHYIIVEGVAAKAYRDDDKMDDAAAARAEYEDGIQTMANELLVPNYDSPASLVTYGSSDW